MTSRNILMVKVGYLDQLYRDMRAEMFSVVLVGALLVVLAVLWAAWLYLKWRLRKIRETPGAIDSDELAATKKKPKKVDQCAVVLSCLAVLLSVFVLPGSTQTYQACRQYITMIESQELISVVSVRGQDYQTVFDTTGLPDDWMEGALKQNPSFNRAFSVDISEFPDVVCGGAIVNGTVYGVIEGKPISA